MIDIKFKECCNTCASLDVYTEVTNVYSDNVKNVCVTMIGCNHEKVCGAYLNSGVIKEPETLIQEPVTLKIGGV